MAFSGVIGLGLRHGVSRLSASSTIRVSNARLYSSFLNNSRTISLPHISPRSRNISSSSTTPSSTSPILGEVNAGVEDTISSAPDTLGTITDGITDTILSNVPVALQYGDMAALGLAAWTPAGIVRWSMELINVSTSLPWFWTIVIGSAFWRLCCVPLAITGLRESARMQPVQQEFLDIRNKITETALKRAPLEHEKAKLAMKNFQEKHELKPFRSAISLGQLPITLGLFFGVQKLGKLPLEQLKDSGFSLLPDLTVPDPTYVLPVIFCAIVNAQIMAGARDINTQQNPGMGHIMNLFRVLSIPGMYIMGGFPSVLLVSLLTTASLTTLQSFLLRNSGVRRMLDIPIAPPEARGSLPTFRESYQYLKTKMNPDTEALLAQTAEARRKKLFQQRFQQQPPRS